MKRNKAIKVILAYLLALVLAVTGIGRVDIHAEETAEAASDPKPVTATFIWSSESIKTVNAAYAYVLKAKTGNTIKAGTKGVELTKAEGSGDYTATMADLKIKNPKKDVYLYVCDKEFEKEGKNISANLEIKAPTVKKVAATVNYTLADGYSDTFEIITAKVTDTSKKEIKDPEIWWCTEADGTYYEVNDSDESPTRKYDDKDSTVAPKGFDGKTLKEILSKGGGTIYIKVAGKDGISGTAQFGSKATKVKIAKPAKAPSVKVDVKKNVIALKNGFDFQFVSKVNGEYTEPYEYEWFTILPYLKTASVKKPDESIVSIGDYTPLAKNDANAGKAVPVVVNDYTWYTYSYTAYKFKTVNLTRILWESGRPDDNGMLYLAVRKSATEKKPASEVTYIEIKQQSEAPLIYTKENVQSCYTIDTTTDFDKAGLSIGTILPNPGRILYDGEEYKNMWRRERLATEGYAESFKVVTSVSGGKVIGADTNGSTYEYTVVRTADLGDDDNLKSIDWATVSWKKLEAGKTKFTSKLKASYKLMDGTKVSEKFTANNDKYCILVRRAGVQSGNVPASECTYLYVEKDGKEYNLIGDSVGEEAYKYNIKFVKYKENAEGSYGWYLADDIDEISVWMAPTAEKYVKLPQINGAKYFKAEESAKVFGIPDTSESGAVTLETGTENNGKYAISTQEQKKDFTEYLAIREYANITVKQEISGDISKETIIFQQKNGKITYANGAASSGEATLFVGDTYTLQNYAAPSSISGYVLSNKAPSSSGVVTFAPSSSGEATAASVSKDIKTAEETVITIRYKATALYEVTIDATNANGDVTVEQKNEDDTWTQLTLTDNKISLPNKTVIRITDTISGTTDIFTEVTFDGVSGNLDKSTKQSATSKPIRVNSNMTIKVVGTKAKTDSQEGN